MHTTTSVRTVLCSSRREITLISLRLTVPNRQVMGPRRMSCGTGLTPSNSSFCSTVFHLVEKSSLVWVPCTISSLYIKVQPAKTVPRRHQGETFYFTYFIWSIMTDQTSLRNSRFGGDFLSARNFHSRPHLTSKDIHERLLSSFVQTHKYDDSKSTKRSFAHRVSLRLRHRSLGVDKL